MVFLRTLLTMQFCNHRHFKETSQLHDKKKLLKPRPSTVDLHLSNCHNADNDHNPRQLAELLVLYMRSGLRGK